MLSIKLFVLLSSILRISCPVNAISGVPGKEPYVIDQAKCIKCGLCLASCPFKAIIKK